MTPERLAEIREALGENLVQIPGRMAQVGPARFGLILGAEETIKELLTHIDELTRQLSDARDKAINAGIFTSSDGDESKYTHALNMDTCEDCGRDLWNGLCSRCETETSTPGATSYKPPAP